MAQKLAAIAVLIAASAVTAAHGRSVAEASAGNTCPAGYGKITSRVGCIAAMDILGPGSYESHGDSAFPATDFNGVENDAAWPSGCYWCDGVPGCQDGVWFNEHPTGAANGGATPICAQGLEPLQTGGVLWMGDSDTDYWATTSILAPGSHNVAVGGFTCSDLEGELPQYLSAFQPEVVVLTCGENDLFGSSVDETFASFARVVAAIRASGARVITMGTKAEPTEDVQDLHDDYVIYDSMVQGLAVDLASDGPILTAVDVQAGFTAIGNPDSLYAEDLHHLSSQGYALWDLWASQALVDPTCVIWRNGICNRSVVPPSSSYTCGDIKEAYKDNGCCGNPSKIFVPPADARRLSGTSAMNEEEQLLSEIRAADRSMKKRHGKHAFNALAKEIHRVIRPFLK